MDGYKKLILLILNPLIVQGVFLFCMVNQKVIKYFEVFLVVCFLIVGFVPYLDAVDKIAPQFLYLSILNSIASFYNFFNYKKINFRYAGYVLLSLFSLSIWSFFSLFYAINKAEVLIETSRIIIYLLSFVNLYLLQSKNKEILNYIPYILTLILVLELTLVYERFFERFTYEGYSRDMGLRAFAGNINITAFSLLFKLPFLLYVISDLKAKYIFTLLALSSYSFCLFVLGSRGANLFFVVIVIITSLLYLYHKKYQFISKKYFYLFLFSILIGGSINSYLFKGNQSLNVIQRSTNLDTSSTQQRLRFYNAAIESISERPFFGVGIGNWKLHATEYDKPYMKDYTVPYHVHNDFLEVFAELGFFGVIFYYGIYLWIFFLIFKSIKDKEFFDKKYSILIIPSLLSILVYLADSFLNFPFTRPIMQIQNLFIWALILVIIARNFKSKNFLSFQIFHGNIKQRAILLILILSGLCFSSFISLKVFQSFKEQQFLTAAGNGGYTNYTINYVESIDSTLPSITATTIPIETLKANLIYNKLSDGEIDDSLHNMISEGKKANPFLPYNELTKSVLYIKQKNPDSAYVYAKKAFYSIPNHNLHFALLLDIAEALKDSLEVNKAINSISAELRNEFYEKYLEVSFNIKNNIGVTESKFLEKYSSKNPDSDYSKIFNTMFEVGKKNVEDGYFESQIAKKYFNEKKFENAAESFVRAFGFNPLELSYYENAANSYMQAGKDEKAIEILKDVISKLNPKTGKSEYLLGIIYIGQKKNIKGCEYLKKSKAKGFPVNDYLFRKFCASD